MFVIAEGNRETKFLVNNTKLYVDVVTLSENVSAEFFGSLRDRFKRNFYCGEIAFKAK